MILSAKNISKSFTDSGPVQLFSNLSIEIQKGQSIAITGKSGSGKTTLLHILGTLDCPDSGDLYIANQKVTKKNASILRSHHIGFVFQDFNLLEDFSSLDNILMPAMIDRRNINKEYGMHLLEKVGLQDKAFTPVNKLSGGEKQRIAIARALCNNPDLILADEPTGNLDQENSDRVMDLLFSCVTKDNKSLILVTHDIKLAKACQATYQLSNSSLTSI